MSIAESSKDIEFQYGRWKRIASKLKHGEAYPVKGKLNAIALRNALVRAQFKAQMGKDENGQYWVKKK